MSLTFDQIHTEKKQKFLFEMMEKTARDIKKIKNESPKLDNCPICETKNIEDYTRAFGFDMSRCVECGLLFCNPYPNNDQLKAYYNSEMKSFENEFFLESFDSRVQLFGPRVDLIHALKPHGRLLDIGSAIGVFVAALHMGKSPLDITCCDLSPEACDALRQRYPDVRVINDDISNLVDAGGYDIITMWDTIEHIVDQNKMLLVVEKLLADDGIFVFSTPNTRSFEWLIAQEKHTQVLPPGHVNLMNEYNIKLLLKRNGFDLAQSHTLNASLDISYVQKLLKQKKINPSNFGGFIAEVLEDPNFVELLEGYLIENRMAGNILVVACKTSNKKSFQNSKNTTDVDTVLEARNQRTAQRISQKFYKGLLNEGYASCDVDSLYISGASGAYMTDFDGNKLLDLGMAAGSALLGHAHQDIVGAIKKQAGCGVAYIRPTFLANEFGEALNDIFPHHSAFALCNSGSEATMRALRIARAHTGKRKIALFAGGWHGGQDGTLVGEDYLSSSKEPDLKPLSSGLLWPVNENILMLPYNSEYAFELIDQHANELAMIFVEPAQGAIPLDTVGPFLKKIREKTSKQGILLGFDEIITGLRLCKSGGAGYFGIEPDISTYGKIIGGGLAIGAIGVSDEIELTVRYGQGETLPVFMGGTFSANPLALASGFAVLKHVNAAGVELYKSLNHLGKKLRRTVNDYCVEKSLPAQMIGLESMSRIVFSDKEVRCRRDRDEAESWFEDQEKFQRYCRFRGLHLPTNGVLFLSTAHSEEDVNEAACILCEGIEYVLANTKDENV
ncbi:MAG: aminotransferase class III-fold pyridoxal phosphate-dependent enzyme [Pseudomonadota bacterium]|nr:aminotransferase class III-fold pyridoxal phosphate-dependent enzyme [Pseudomonadota bacterium]